MAAIDQKVKIVSNARKGERFFELTFSSFQMARLAVPGQFVEVKVCKGLAPLLRRPLGIHKVSGEKVSLFYEAVGSATEILSRRKAGEEILIMGPLGRGFVLPQKKTDIALIAGGMGVAPLLFLAQKIKSFKPRVFIGGCTKRHVLCAAEFKRLGCQVMVSTDDGSCGERGFVTELLLKQKKLPAQIYACGPHPMLKAVSAIAGKHGIPSQLSLEAHMACGIGACLGCVVETSSGYQRVCKEGPVFDSAELLWAKEET